MAKPRIVPLDRTLLQQAIAISADQSFISVCKTPEFEARALSNPAYALIAGGELLGAGGVVLHWPGLAEGWLLPSALASRRHLAAATRGMRAWIDQLQRDPVFRRIEIRIKAAAPWRLCWSAAMGFGDGQLLEAWGPDGSDHFLFARVVKGEH